jgi:hypothetical protein
MFVPTFVVAPALASIARIGTTPTNPNMIAATTTKLTKTRVRDPSVRVALMVPPAVVVIPAR